ncbi:MAG: hypothetical protein OJF49_000168 [Ktedonobacterales bacterium]|jgi:CcmD family protein|nr:MAG: hypothetical protein OJF49_000168 [Ktedonobacterales bacterium]
MNDNGFLIAAYLIVWLGLLGYLGWVTLRMRGVQADLQAVRELVEQRDQPNASTPHHE